MNHRIRITMDDNLIETLKAQAAPLGLSVSAVSRLALPKGLKQSSRRRHDSLIDAALADIKADRKDTLTLDEFDRQIDAL